MDCFIGNWIDYNQLADYVVLSHTHHPVCITLLFGCHWVLETKNTFEFAEENERAMRLRCFDFRISQYLSDDA